MKQQMTSRLHAKSVRCPDCGAAPGDPCVGRRGKVRESMHMDRHLRFTATRPRVIVT